jgi:hypothetical protein
VVARIPWLLSALALVVFPVSSVCGVEYRLYVASISDEALQYYARGPVGSAAGELTMVELERALDRGEVPHGSLLYDRDIIAAGPGVARAFGAAVVRSTSSSTSHQATEWKMVQWDGTPGQRAVWIVRPATMHRNEAKYLALSGIGSGLRYFIPYGVSLSSTPQKAISYRLDFLRAYEDGGPLWDRYLNGVVDLSDALAAVVGVYPRGDWVYLLVEQPPTPMTFKVAIGWALRGPNDRVFPSERVPSNPRIFR